MNRKFTETDAGSRATVKPGLCHVAFLIGCLMLVGAYLMLNQSAPAPRALPFAADKPLTKRFLLVDVDGMRADFARDATVMPHLAGMAARGSSGISEACAITLSLPSIKAWTTGVGFAARDMVADFWNIDPQIDSLFRLAHNRGGSIAFAGPPEWIRSFSAHFDASFTHDNAGHDTAKNDEQTQERARAYAAGGRFNIIAVHYVNADMTAHMHGVRSGHYAKSLRRIDSYIHELVTLSPPDLTVLVIADHGTTDEGSHWALDPVVIDAPFVLSGPGVTKSDGLRVQAVDIAPTLAALLGTGFPRRSEGRIALDVLDADPEHKAAWETEYGAVRLEALRAAALDDPDAADGLQQARLALANHQPERALAAARQVQARSNARLSEMLHGRSGRIMLVVAALGAFGCALLAAPLLKQRPRAPLPAGWRGSSWVPTALWTLAGVCVMCAVWYGAISLQTPSRSLVLPFRTPMLMAHWKAILVAVAAISAIVALLPRILRGPIDGRRWWPAVLLLAAAMFVSAGRIHDNIHWIVLVTLAAWAIHGLVGGRKPLAPLALLASFGASLVARKITTITNAVGGNTAIWSLLAGLAALAGGAIVLTSLIRRQADAVSGRPTLLVRLARVPPPIQGLWIAGALALAARFADVMVADRYLLAAIAACLAAFVRSPGRQSGDSLLAAWSAVLAALPLLYPSYYFPVIVLAMVAAAMSDAKGVVERRPASSLAAIAVIAIFFLYFALSGVIDLRVIDARRMMLLDPRFGFDYPSIARVVVLMIVQLVVPTFAVLVWLAHALQKRRDVWAETVSLLHLFFLAQFVSVIVYLQFQEKAMNSTFDHLSQLICMFGLYVGLHISVAMAGRIMWRPVAGVVIPAGAVHPAAAPAWRAE